MSIMKGDISDSFTRINNAVSLTKLRTRPSRDGGGMCGESGLKGQTGCGKVQENTVLEDGTKREKQRMV